MKISKLFASLVTRIVLVGVLLVLLAGVARYVLVARSVQADLLEVVSRQQNALAAAIARNIDYKLTERERMVKALAADIPQALLFDPDLLRPWLEERLRLVPLFSKGVLVLDLTGTVRVDAPMLPNRLGSSLATNRDFIDALGGRAGIGRPLVSRLTGVGVLPFVSPVRDANGTVRAVLMATTALDAPGFLDRLQYERIGKTGGFLLISPRDQLFISADNPQLSLRPTPAPGKNLLHDKAMAGFRGSGVTINAFGVEELSAVASVPSAGWFVVARIPTAEALAAIDQTRSFIVRYSVIELLLAAVIVGLLSWRVLRPLHYAAEQAKRMTQGQAPLSPLPVMRDDEVGSLTGAFNQLILKLSDSQTRLEHMAHHDRLTGLLNRNVVSERIEVALQGVARSGRLAALFFIDLDGFKAINDELGHDVGDQVLKEVANRLGLVTRSSDILARIGGDEFVLFVPDITGSTTVSQIQTVQALAWKVIETVSIPIAFDNTIRSVGASIGIALSTGQTGVQAMMTTADTAMYEAKALGKKRFVIAPFKAQSQASERRSDARSEQSGSLHRIG